MAKRGSLLMLAGVICAGTLVLTSCAGNNAPSDDAKAEGEITFLTNRTDLETNGTWDAYIKEFQKTYPDVDVKVEAITNYGDDVRTRLNSPNGYGDVLSIPIIPGDQFGDFFEPLGKTADMEKEYRFLTQSSYDGVQYGIALGGNANGIMYNTEVFKKAGITELPRTNEEFIEALKKVKANTDAIPYYTNYKDGWPLGGQWSSNIGAVTGDVDASNEMAHDKAPWTEGTDIYGIDSLLYDIVHEGLSEPDPLTTNWEQSKGDFVTGKIGAMVLGSWALSQFQAAAKDAGVDPSVVGYMAFPANTADKQYSVIGGDYGLAINKNSSHKAAARAWLDWLIQKSGFTDKEGTISAVRSAPLPQNLSSLSDGGVELIELTPAPAGEEALFNNIADESQVDIWGNLYRQRLVDTARGQAPGDKASFFAELNEKWGAAVQKLAG